MLKFWNFIKINNWTLLSNYKNQLKLKGDQSLSKRDFSRIIKPMKMFGQNIISKIIDYP